MRYGRSRAWLAGMLCALAATAALSSAPGARAHPAEGRAPPDTAVRSTPGPVTAGGSAAQPSVVAPAVHPAQTGRGLADVDGRFPGWPLWVAFAAIAVSGAAGAFASDLVIDGGRIDCPRRTDTGWMLGWVGKLSVGAVAAMIALMLNPPDRAWATLVGTALSAGVGGEAILLAVLARRQADAAESERDRARDHAEVIARTASEQLDCTRQAVITVYRSQVAVASPAGALGAEHGAGVCTPQDGGDPFERSVNSAFAQARRALAAVTGPASLWEQVRAILLRRLGPRDVDTRPLGELADARTLRLVANDIIQRFPHLSSCWSAEDVRPDSTLASLVNDIDGKSV